MEAKGKVDNNMVSVDEHTEVAIQIVSKGVKLTENLILGVLNSLEKLFKNDDKEQNLAIKDNTKEGKQKIKDLVKKHKDGVMALDDNVNKEQLKDYQNEFKKLGVDFSVIKNDAESYSFFFVSRDINVIEKALKNIIEKKNKSMEKENEVTDEPKKDIILETEGNKLESIFNELSPPQQALFIKINEIEIANKINQESINDLKKGLSQEQIASIESLYKENVFTGNDEVPKDKILSTEIGEIESSIEKINITPSVKENVIEVKEKELEGKINSLSPKEQELFTKINELEELKEGVSNEQLKNIQNLHSEYTDIHTVNKQEQLDNVFQQLSPEEKEFFMETNEFMMNSDSQEHLYKYTEARDKLSDTQIDKITDLYDKNIHDTKNKAPKGMIHMNDVDKLAADLVKSNEVDTNLEDNIIAKELANETPNKDLSIDEKRNEIADKFPSKEAQLENVLNQLDPLEKDLFLQLNKSELEKGPEFKEFTKLMELREHATDQQILKVNELHSLHVFKKEGTEAPRGTIHMKDIEGITGNLTRQKDKQAEQEKSTPIFSVGGVKEIDKKLKEQDNDKNKDKKRTQSLER